MKDHYTTYIRQVGRKLDLPRRQKKELLRGFRLALEDRFAEMPDEETLLRDVGKPEDVACALLASVDSKERRRHSVYKIFRLRFVVVVLAFLLALSVGTFCYFDATRAGRVEITIISDPVPTQYSTNINVEPRYGGINKS